MFSLLGSFVGRSRVRSPADDLYRPDIDGLRAIAVLFVIASHAFPERLPGGFVGVDIFFVISGFLISSLSWRRAERKEFSIIQFYLRRVRRIFPALLIVLAFAALAGWLILLPMEFRDFGESIKAMALFVPNFFYSERVFYFGTRNMPLLHLWSLGVEEQFYVLWPVLFAVLCRSRRFAALLFSLIGVSSLAIAFRNGGHLNEPEYFLPQFHAWELAAGCVLGCFNLRPQKHGNLIATFGIALIALSVAWAGSAYSIASVSPAVAGALGLLAAGRSSFVAEKILARKGMVAVGLISYPLYLWHWPLMSFAWFLLGPLKIKAGHYFFVIALSFPLAAFTYRFIERPMRNAGTRAAAFLVLSLAIIGLGGAWAGIGGIAPRSAAYGLDKLVAPRFRIRMLCDRKMDLDGFSLCSMGNEAEKVLIWGDSNALQYAPRIEHLVYDKMDKSKSAVLVWSNGCIPVAQPGPAVASSCGGSARIVSELVSEPSVSTIILAARWHTYFETARSAGELPQLYDSFERQIKAWRTAGKKVVIVLSTPCGGNFGPESMVKRSVFGNWGVDFSGLDRQEWEAIRGPSNRAFGDLGRRAGADIIDPTPILCNKKTCLPIDEEGVPIYYDSCHLSADYTHDHVQFLDRIFVPDTRRKSN